VRLASKLIDWEIDVRSKNQVSEKEAATIGKSETKVQKSEEEKPSIAELDGVGKKIMATLIKAGFDTIEKIKNATVEDLVRLEGIGKKTAEKIINSATSK
ncbi:MAG: helix-hairpin-helix domain-containing protein, partial [Candidatus Omnitrophica bacterium]|nr:helix-hairpin-helix domain-containing protein [Candidatus Omnitrophota bacterium]